MSFYSFYIVVGIAAMAWGVWLLLYPSARVNIYPCFSSAEAYAQSKLNRLIGFTLIVVGILMIVEILIL